MGPPDGVGVSSERELYVLVLRLFHHLMETPMVRNLPAVRRLTNLITAREAYSPEELLDVLELLHYKLFSDLGLTDLSLEQSLDSIIERAAQLAGREVLHGQAVVDREHAREGTKSLLWLIEASWEQELTARGGLVERQRALGGDEPPEADHRPTTNTVAVSAYVAADEAYDAVEKALAGVLEAFGLEMAEKFPKIYGSIFRAILARTKTFFSSPEMQANLTRMARGIELQAIHRVQAEVDAAQSAAVAGLITALAQTPEAIIQIGSILLIKVDGVLAVRNLSQLELAYLERNPNLFRNPTAALRALQRVNRVGTG